MKDYYKLCEVNFENPYLRTIIISINTIFRTCQNEIASLCYYFFKLKEFFKEKGLYYKAFGHIDKDRNEYGYSDIIKLLGYDDSTVNKFIQCYEKFVINTDLGIPSFKDEFKLFTITKLMEMLPISLDTLLNCIKNKIIRSDMTVKELRSVIKKLKSGDNTDKVTEKKITPEQLDESEKTILEDYDPKKVYEISYFEKFSKIELISMIFSLQQYAHGRGKIKTD